VGFSKEEQNLVSLIARECGRMNLNDPGGPERIEVPSWLAHEDYRHLGKPGSCRRLERWKGCGSVFICEQTNPPPSRCRTVSTTIPEALAPRGFYPCLVNCRGGYAQTRYPSG
jgi:hypothetical protein